MDHSNSTTNTEKRKRGSHLTDIERGAIQALHREEMSLRQIAARIGCSPATVLNELRRGTPPRKGKRGRVPGYSATRGSKTYRENRKRCRRKCRVLSCRPFVEWCVKMFRTKHWSLDACVGYARLHKLFPEEAMVCTHTLYNAVWRGLICLTPTDLPDALKRKKAKEKMERENQRNYGESIENRDKIAEQRVEFGHWEGDTVVGTRDGSGPVVLSLIEKMTQNYLVLKIAGRTAEAVAAAMEQLREEYGDKFAEVFKTITVDNGPEFSAFASFSEWGTKVYFAHPYSSWERPQNERHNGMFRRYSPKGVSMEMLTVEDVDHAMEMIDGLPRKKLGYRTPEELFDACLDEIYAA